MQTATIEITNAMEPYVNKRDMCLEMDKWSLIQLYGSMGIPYIDMDEAELERDIANALAACGESK